MSPPERKNRGPGVQKSDWPGWLCIEPEAIATRLRTWPELPPLAKELFPALLCLCAEFPPPLNRERKDEAKTIRKAASLIAKGRTPWAHHLSKLVRNYNGWPMRPLSFAVVVVQRANAEPKFALEGAEEGRDVSLFESLLVLGMEILSREHGSKLRGKGQMDRSTESLLGQAIDLVVPMPGRQRPRDPRNISTQYAHARKGWQSMHPFLDEAPELLRRFRNEPECDLLVFVEEWRWETWTPAEGIPDEESESADRVSDSV